MMEMRAGMEQRRRREGALALPLALILACAALPCAAQVGPLTYQNLFFNQSGYAQGNYLAADAGFVYTDNAGITNNAAGDTLAAIGLEGNVAYRGPRLDFRLDSDIAAVKYLHGTYPLEPTGYLDGGAELKILPGTFSWTARETYSELVINPYQPAAPENLESIDTVSTGPRFIFQPTLRTTVTLDALYSYIYTHSISPLYVDIDNHRYGGSLKVERAFSSVSSIYFTGDYEKVFFKDLAINHNFTVADAILGYKVETGRTVLNVSGGYTELRQFDVLVPIETVIGTEERSTTRKFSTPNWSLTLSRVLTPTQRLEIFAYQQMLDAANLFQAGLTEAVPALATPQAAIGAPLVNRIYGADWRVQGQRTSLDIGLLDTHQRYELGSDEHRELKDASVLVSRRVAPTIDWDIGVRFEHQDVTGFGGVNASTEITNLRWRVGERLGVRFLYAHSTFAGVSDNQVGVLVSYSLLRGGGTAQQPALSPYGLQPVSPLSTLPPPP